MQVLRYSFCVRGHHHPTIAGSNNAAHATALQRDGEIIAVGYSNNGSNNDFALARYSSNGILDTDFGDQGKKIVSIGSNHDYANAVAIQPDGKIVAAGYSFNESNADFALIRVWP